MKDLETNDPVMWRKKEYKFVGYSERFHDHCWITRLGVNGSENNTMRHVPIAELDLILEFDFE